ncbi:tetratricopeptide repeat-containing sensor histidine kinase [Kordia antarctica]|uniref:tetratricopeptide repeat-containing sensor histidine kinase n=1 Tax=Kordia antarctica TaxID=1218801 RepID=UPI001359048A|nr:sensor histidine kinase [Kordia antarctica]
MKVRLTKRTGIPKIETLDSLVWSLRKKKDSSGIKYALQELQLSKKINYTKGEVNALNFLGKIAKIQGHKIDAETYFLQALSIAKKNNLQHEIARGYNELGIFYEKENKIVAAIDAFLSSSESFEAQDNLKAAAKATANLGDLYKEIEAYPEALEYYLKSLAFSEKIADSLGLARIYLKLATLDKHRENYVEMLENALKAKQLFVKLERPKDVFNSNLEIGRAYDYLDQDEKSKEVYLETLKLIPEYKIKDASSLYHNLATLYKENGRIDSALYYYQKAQKVFIEKNDTKELSTSYNNLGNLYLELGNYKESLLNFNQSLALQETIKDSSLLQKTYVSLSNYYQTIGDFEKAYNYKDSSENVREDIYKKMNATNRFELGYMNDKREMEAQKNVVEKALLNAEQMRQIIIIILIAIVILFFVILRNRKLKQQKKESELAFEQQKLATQLEKEKQEKKLEEMLQAQERKAISKMISGQEKERERIAKDLHDRLGSMLSVVKIHYKSVEDDLQKIKNETKSQYEKANQLLDEACETVRKIAHNMISGTLTKFGLVPALKELKQKIEETKMLQIELVTHGLDNRLDNSTEIQLYRIIQELLNNILKHAEATEVTIQLLKREADLNIMVTDNGIGFDIKNLTDEGMGLKSIKARVAEMNGNVLIDSSQGNGTTITLEIPT